MHQSQRFMRRQQDADDSEAALRLFLERAPGIIGISLIEIHRKGGYRAVSGLAPDCVDVFVAELEKNGWMTVV